MSSRDLPDCFYIMNSYECTQLSIGSLLPKQTNKMTTEKEEGGGNWKPSEYHSERQTKQGQLGHFNFYV